MSLISIDKITIDERLQHREILDEEMIAAIRDSVKRGEKIPAVILIYDGKTHWMPDGHHRYYAHKAAGSDWIEAHIYDGDFRAAWLYSLGVNTLHGIRRSYGDLQRILEKAFADEEVAGSTTAVIAARLNCSESAVRKYRAELENIKNGAELVATLPEAEPEAGTNNTPKAPPVVNRSINEAAKRKKLLKEAQRVYCQLANLVQEMQLWDVLTPHLAAIKKHTGVI